MANNRLRGSDYRNLRLARRESETLYLRAVIFLKFVQWLRGDGVVSVNTPVYTMSSQTVDIEEVDFYDIDRSGVRRQGDLHVQSRFQIRGLDEAHGYGGDLILWRQKIWRVAEVVSAYQVAGLSLPIFYHTIMRQADSNNPTKNFVLQTANFALLNANLQ